MKKIFKLAAIAVSMALVAGLVACSSGDDDVVDTSTGKYLLAAQINKYVDSIEYAQNVSGDEIKGLKDTHEDVMKTIIDDGCADCLQVYFDYLKDKLGDYVGEKATKLYSGNIKVFKSDFERVKNYYGEKKVFHEACVYKPAIKTALDEDPRWDGEKIVVVYLSEALTKVENIGKTTYDNTGKVVNDNSILDGKLNDRQAASMKEYTDAYDALKAALNKDHSEKYKEKFEAVDKTIKAFNDLNKDVKEKETGKVTKDEIKKVLDAVNNICKDIATNVYDTLTTKVELDDDNIKADIIS